MNYSDIEEVSIICKSSTLWVYFHVQFICNKVSNFTPVTLYLSHDREKVTSELQYVLDNTDEMEMRGYRIV